MAFSRKHLTPSNVIAVAAMCVALSSTATAAVLMTGGDIKDETLTSADVKDGSLRGADIKNRSIEVRDLSSAASSFLKGQTGPAGPVGPAGPKGDAGRSALQTLASGETIVGGFNIDTSAPNSGDDFRTWVPFPIAAPAIPTVALKSTDPTCTGTVDAPTAPAGKVCVYEGGTSPNAELYAIAGRATTTGTNPSLWVGAAAARRGFVVDLTVSGSAGDAFTIGSWAYTAP